MSLDQVSFPALIVADDGWVEELAGADAISRMTRAAVAEYSKRRVILYDSQNRAWRFDSLSPTKAEKAFRKSMSVIVNSQVEVDATLTPITDSPLQTVPSALMEAVDVDDDILTQYTEASELKKAISKALCFEDLLAALRASRAI